MRRSKHENEKIEVILTKSGIITRLILLVIALSIASVAFYNIFTKVLHTKSGWQMVTANTKSIAGSEFAFNYQFGVSDMSPSVEWSTLNKAYSTLLDEGYNLFSNDEVTGIGNLYQINTHPNEEIYLEPELYAALKKINASGSRFIFYAPVFEQYRALLSCEDEYAAADFDPYENEEVAEYVKRVCDYAKDENYIRIELGNDNKAKLVVSDEYMAFAKENEISIFLDLFFARNAFLIDYVSDRLIDEGYTAGVITSVEGYVRALGEGDYSIKRYFYNDGNTPREQIYSYNGPKSIVSLRGFPLYGEKSQYFYVSKDETVRNIYINPETGLCVDSFNQVLAASSKTGCSDILLPLYDCIVKEEKFDDISEEYGIEYISESYE